MRGLRGCICAVCDGRTTAQAFDYLDAPVERVTGADLPTPYAKALEDLAFPDVPVIVKVIKRSLFRA